MGAVCLSAPSPAQKYIDELLQEDDPTFEFV